MLEEDGKDGEEHFVVGDACWVGGRVVGHEEVKEGPDKVI